MRATPFAALAVLLALLAGGASAACVKGKSGCTACTGNRCSACAAGWGMHPKGYCVKCTSTRCAKCKGGAPGTCLKCNVGSYLIAGGKCQPCADHCAACKNGSGTCIRCDAKYHPHNGHCDIDCAAGRKGCTECKNGKCIKCKSPGNMGKQWVVWYMQSQGTCKQCQLNFENNRSCRACAAEAPARCTECEDKAGRPMYIDNFGACQFCSEGCKACESDSGRCTQCDGILGFILTPLGICIQLPIIGR